MKLGYLCSSLTKQLYYPRTSFLLKPNTHNIVTCDKVLCMNFCGWAMHSVGNILNNIDAVYIQHIPSDLYVPSEQGSDSKIPFPIRFSVLCLSFKQAHLAEV